MKAIQPYERRARRTDLELASGDVACDVRLDRIDRQLNIAKYTIALANASDADVSCRLYSLDRSDVATDLATLNIAAHSAGRADVTIPLRSGRSSDVLHVEVLGTGTQLQSITHVPSATRLPTWPKFLAIVGAVVASISFVIFAYEAVPPSLLLAAPASIKPGPLTLTYGYDRARSARYRAVASDGTVIDRGVLKDATGTIAFVVPENLAGSTLALDLETRGMLGPVTKRTTLNVRAEPVATIAPARIAALTAHRETYDGTTAVLASYLAVADSGTIRISDANDRTVASADFTRRGTNRIALPADVNAESLQVLLTVARGNSRATASVELPPEASSATAVIAAPTPLPTARAAAPIAAIGFGDTLPQSSDPVKAIGRVVSGIPFDVSIVQWFPNMRVTLQDQSGTELDARDIPAGTETISFTVPEVTTDVTYFLSCTFTRNASEETIVRALPVYSR